MQKTWTIVLLITLMIVRADAIKDGDADLASITAGLTSSDPAVRKSAYDAAVRLGPPMVTPLLDILSRGGAAEAHTAQAALTRIVGAASAPQSQRQAEEVRQALLTRLRQGGDNNDRARTVAAQLVGIIGVGDRSTARTLKDAVLAGGSVSAAALEAMQRIPGRRMTEGLMDALRKVQPSGKVAIILALGARKDIGALPELSRLAQKESGEIQVAALRALGMLGSAQAVPMLQAVAQSGAESSRKAAVDALLLLADAPGLHDSSRTKILQAAHKFAVTDAQIKAAESALKK